MTAQETSKSPPSSAARGKSSVAIDIAVVGRGRTYTRRSAEKSAATKAEDEKRREFNQRVSDIKDVLILQNLPPWVPHFWFRPFGVDTYGVLGKEAQAIFQQLAEKKADWSPMPVGLCKRIALEALSETIHSANAGMIRSRRPNHTLQELLPPYDIKGGG